MIISLEFAVSLVALIVSAFGWLVTLGVYKGKIDRHELVINTIMEAGMARLFNEGRVRKGSNYFLADADKMPKRTRELLDTVSCPSYEKILEVLTPQDVAEICSVYGVDTTCAIGLAVSYVNGKKKKVSEL